VMGVRERLRANGVINPRFKGGGRASRGAPVAGAAPAAAGAATVVPRPTPPAGPPDDRAADQTVFDRASRPAAEAATTDQTLFEPGAPGGEGTPGAATDGDGHPAVTALLAERVGANLVQALSPAERERLAQALRELERRGRATRWLPDLHRGMRRQLGLAGAE